MTIQTSGDDCRESEAEQTSRKQFEAVAKSKGLINDDFGIRTVNEQFLDACWIFWQASRAAIEPPPPILLPPPITEADGYRLNTSWHSGAIFRDGANWMRDEALRLGAGIPDGWQLVPITPSPKQWAAGLKTMEGGIDKVTLAYTAMLEASPEAPC